MKSQDRLALLIKIAQDMGILTNLVKTKLNLPTSTEGFKQKFLRMKPGPEREKLVWDEAVKQGPPKKLVPVTAQAEDGSKITYYVMPDMIMSSDGIRLPLTAIQFQKLADLWHMNLPTNKMVDQIYHQADAKIFAPPLSGGGYINGKYYSGKDVVANKIGDSDSKVAYDNMLNKQLDKYNGNYNLVAGHQKEITAPILDPNKLNFYGWYFKGKPIQDSKQSMHNLQETEYGSSGRAVSNKVLITKPDGSKIETTMDKVLADPSLYKAISDVPGVRRYPV